MNVEFWILSLTITVTTIVLGAVITAVWWGGNANSRLKNLDTRTDGIMRVIEAIQKSIGDIHRDIGELFGRIPSATVGERSPLGLTELGLEISAELFVREWTDTVVAELAEKLQDKEEFEVHRFCIDYVDEMINSEPAWDRKVEKSAYNHGLSRDKVSIVIAIELRDALLNLRKQSDSAS